MPEKHLNLGTKTKIMVKCIGPLMSQDASGKVGAIVYQRSKYGTIARPHVPQRYKPSEAQLQQNYFFGVAADAWRELTPAEKQVYNDRAVRLKMTGFNLFIKETIEHPE